MVLKVLFTFGECFDVEQEIRQHHFISRIKVLKFNGSNNNNVIFDNKTNKNPK